MVVLKDQDDPQLQQWIKELQEYWKEPHSGVKAVRNTIKFFIERVPQLQRNNNELFEKNINIENELRETNKKIRSISELFESVQKSKY